MFLTPKMTASEAAEELGRTEATCEAIMAMPIRTVEELTTAQTRTSLRVQSTRQMLAMMFNDPRVGELFNRAGRVRFNLDDARLDIAADQLHALLASHMCALSAFADLVCEQRDATA